MSQDPNKVLPSPSQEWRDERTIAHREHWRRTFAGRIMANFSGDFRRPADEVAGAAAAVRAAEALCDALGIPGKLESTS